jgi:hypothetical protein
MPNRLQAVPHSAELRLTAMPHSAEFLQKISSPTPRYATQREIQFKIFWSTPCYAAQRGVDSALCGIVRSRNSPLCGISQSRDSALSINSTIILLLQDIIVPVFKDY